MPIADWSSKMKRSKARRKASAILTADLHLTDTAPVSRTDDYMAAQQEKLEFLSLLSIQNNNCPILCAGDIFNYWKATPWLCAWAYQVLPDMITIPGNHDLPMHSPDQYGKSALNLLQQVGKLKVLTAESPRIVCNELNIIGVPFGQLAKMPSITTKGVSKERRILLLHKLIWPGSRPKWAKQGSSFTADEILTDFGNQFDLIVTGDNHRSFVVEQNDCLLVNPGSMMRITADQVEFKPCCYLYYAEDNKVEPVFFPIQDNVHDISHLVSKQERDTRLTAYIERMGQEWEQGVSFRSRLQMFFDENKTPSKIQDIIWEHLEKEA